MKTFLLLTSINSKLFTHNPLQNLDPAYLFQSHSLLPSPMWSYTAKQTIIFCHTFRSFYNSFPLCNHPFLFLFLIKYYLPIQAQTKHHLQEAFPNSQSPKLIQSLLYILIALLTNLCYSPLYCMVVIFESISHTTCPTHLCTLVFPMHISPLSL